MNKEKNPQNSTEVSNDGNTVLAAGRFEYMSYQTWVKNNFYRKPKGVIYSQLLKAKGFYECGRICNYYTQDSKNRKEAVRKWIEEDKEYSGIIAHNQYSKIVFYNPYNDARTYVYLGK